MHGYGIKKNRHSGAARHNRESREEVLRFGSGPAAVILIPANAGINALVGITPLLATASGKAGKGQESQKTCLNSSKKLLVAACDEKLLRAFPRMEGEDEVKQGAILRAGGMP